ncbi:MAG TPA: hypothetical protein VGM24_08855 [Puia sp.]
MDFVFTICSNNYLSQAIVLGNSLKLHEPRFCFLIALVDEKDNRIDYDSIPFEVLPVNLIIPDFDELAQKYNIIELNTSVKPGVIEFLFLKRSAGTVIYLDPDIRVFAPFTELEEAFSQYGIVLTPHIYTPIPLDGKIPSENLFLNYGIYNLGFLGLKNGGETLKFLKWWKERTYSLGYIRISEGLFVDQLPVNLVPLFFNNVGILKCMGYNMAPWNLHERYLSRVNGEYFVNDREKLRFFHFSSFIIDSGELSVPFYNRFNLKERPDLKEIYEQYNEELKSAGYFFYSGFKCSYMAKKEIVLAQDKLNSWKKKSALRRMAIRAVRLFPDSLKKGLAKFGHLE